MLYSVSLTLSYSKRRRHWKQSQYLNSYQLASIEYLHDTNASSFILFSWAYKAPRKLFHIANDPISFKSPSIQHLHSLDPSRHTRVGIICFTISRITSVILCRTIWRNSVSVALPLSVFNFDLQAKSCFIHYPYLLVNRGAAIYIGASISWKTRSNFQFMTSKDTSPTLASTRAQKSSVMSLQNILNDDQSLTSPSSDEDSWPRPPVDKKETTLQKKAPDGPVHFLPHDIGNDPQMLSLFERHTVWPRKDLGSWSEFIPYNMEKNALKLGRNHLCGNYLSVLISSLLNSISVWYGLDYAWVWGWWNSIWSCNSYLVRSILGLPDGIGSHDEHIQILQV